MSESRTGHAVAVKAEPDAAPDGAPPLNAFCVDLEEWFHVCAADTPYRDPATWKDAPARVERDTEVLLELLERGHTHATFPTLGWIAERYPALLRRIAEGGHEVGCHGYYHRLVYAQSPDEFRRETDRARKLLQDVSGQPVTCYRAPGFSITRECFWAYPILAGLGFEVDVSLVPAARGHGGVRGFQRDLLRLETPAGALTVFPVSVMSVAGRSTPFSGGGYLRLFPLSVIRWGFAQNHRRSRPVMAYIHPREIDPDQPRLPLPLLRRVQYYVGVAGCEGKLRRLLELYSFSTVREVVRRHPPRECWSYRDGDLVPAGG